MCPGNPEVFQLRVSTTTIKNITFYIFSRTQIVLKILGFLQWHLMSSENPKNFDTLEALVADELVSFRF